MVLGGGPAGSAAAIELARLGYSVLLVERSRYEQWRVGETLPPYAKVPLQRLGVWEDFLASGHSASYGIHAAWGSPELYENDFIFDPYGAGWHIDRRRFDALLANTAEVAGARVLRGASLEAVCRDQGRWNTRVCSERVVLESRVRYVIDATGRSSRFARLTQTRWIAEDSLLGLVGILDPTSPAPMPKRVLLLEAVEAGWWYSSPLPDGRLLAAFMTDADYLGSSGRKPSELWLQQLRPALHTTTRMQGFSLNKPVHVKKAVSGCLEAATGVGWAAVGDAASAYDPLSAAGVIKALESGLAAAGAINDHMMGNSVALETYASSLSLEFRRYLQKRTTYYGRETRWPRSRFWNRRRSTEGRVPTTSFAHA